MMLSNISGIFNGYLVEHICWHFYSYMKAIVHGISYVIANIPGKYNSKYY
jgi:phage tail protein X